MALHREDLYVIERRVLGAVGRAFDDNHVVVRQLDSMRDVPRRGVALRFLRREAIVGLPSLARLGARVEDEGRVARVYIEIADADVVLARSAVELERRAARSWSRTAYGLPCASGLPRRHVNRRVTLQPHRLGFVSSRKVACATPRGGGCTEGQGVAGY